MRRQAGGVAEGGSTFIEEEERACLTVCRFHLRVNLSGGVFLVTAVPFASKIILMAFNVSSYLLRWRAGKSKRTPYIVEVQLKNRKGDFLTPGSCKSGLKIPICADYMSSTPHSERSVNTLGLRLGCVPAIQGLTYPRHGTVW